MYAFNQVTINSFADELVKIGSIDDMEKDALIERIFGGLPKGVLQAAKMGEKEIAQVAGKGGLGALRGPTGAVGATLRHQGGRAGEALQRATSGANVGAGRIGI